MIAVDLNKLDKFHAHRAGHVSLALGHVGLERETFGRKPETVVNEFGILRDQRVALAFAPANSLERSPRITAASGARRVDDERA